MNTAKTLELVQPETESHEESSYAFFILDGREFGIEVKYVRETINWYSKLTQMPCSMDALDGLINLRGSIIPIINLRTRFHLNALPLNADNRIAITHFDGYLFGLRFDEISEVIRIRKSDIKSVETSDDDPEMCNQGVLSLDGGTRIVQILDLKRLFKKYNLPQVANDFDETRAIFRPKKQDITFVLDGQEYAIDVHAIREIIKPPKISRKVLVDPAIRGVIDLRGELINIVDLRVYFKLSEKEITHDSRIIVLQGEINSGILVDSVKEVIHYEENQIMPIPVFEHGQASFAGIVDCGDSRNIIKLSVDHLFDSVLLIQLKGNTELHTDYVETTSEHDQSSAENCEDITDRVLISFRLDEDYAFDIGLFREIINYPVGIVRIPGLEAYHEGILNLRNSAIPIINLRRYYGMDDFTDVKDSKVIILNLHGKMLGIMVDDIIEIVKPARLKVDRLPNLVAAERGQLSGHHIKEAYRFQTDGAEEKILLIYDVEKLLSDIEMPATEQVTEQSESE